MSLSLSPISNALHTMVCCSSRRHASLAREPSASFSSGTPKTKVAAARARWLTLTPRSLVLSEVVGLFLLVAKEDPTRQRRHQSDAASSRGAWSAEACVRDVRGCSGAELRLRLRPCPWLRDRLAAPAMPWTRLGRVVATL